MSQRIPPFLERLALGRDADAKTIRRAYARELKLIDQEHDLPGFQSLREQYEAALDWAKRQQGQPEPAWQLLEPVYAAPEPASAPLQLDVVNAPAPPPLKPAPPITSEMENPRALADAVFARLVVSTQRIVDLGLLKDPTLLEAEIRLRLDDDELLNITARSLFEARIAHLLLSDWSLEAGVLFGAAAIVFNWEKDSRRLQQFGHAGAFLDRAIEERHMFEGQSGEQLAHQRKVMARLRQAKQPAIELIRRDMFYVERLIAHFPNFMAIMVSRETVEQWRTLAQTTPEVVDTTPEPVLAGYSNKRGFDGAWIFFALIVTFYAAMLWLGRDKPDHSSPAPWPESSQYPSYAPGADPSAPDYNPQGTSQYPVYAPGADPSAPDYNRLQAQLRAKPPMRDVAGTKLDQRIMDAIAADIQYTPAAGSRKGKRTVAYEVLAGANGKIYGVNRLQRSIDPAYDEAVEAAILRAKPLPLSAGAQVRMQFSVEWKKGPPQPKPPFTKLKADIDKPWQEKPSTADERKEFKRKVFGEDAPPEAETAPE